MTASQTGSEGQNLTNEDADRAAASIRPVWEIDDDGEAHVAAADSESPVTPDPPRDTVIDGMPTVALGRTSEAGESAAKTTRSSGEPRKLEAPVPPKNAGPTRIGLGSDDAPDDGWGPENRPSDRPAAPQAEAVAPSAPPAAQVSRAPSAPPARPRVSGNSPVMPQPVSFSKADDPVELPVEKRSGMLYLVGGVALLGVIIGGVFLASSGGEETKSNPTETAQPANTVAPKPTIADPPPVPVETAAPTATAAATVEPTAPPVETAAPTATATEVATPEKPKPANTGTKPGGTGTKPTSTGTKPTGTKPPGGGIIRETPF